MKKVTLFVLLFTSLVATNTSTPPPPQPQQAQEQPAIMPLMIRDAIIKLRDNDFSILAGLIETQYREMMMGLETITVFALDDTTIKSGSPGYVSNVGYHFVPNYFLTLADLEGLPVRTKLPTLERGQSLVVTAAGAGALRINDVGIKFPYVIRNLKIVVHSVYFAFPRIHP